VKQKETNNDKVPRVSSNVIQKKEKPKKTLPSRKKKPTNVIAFKPHISSDQNNSTDANLPSQ